MSLDDLVSVAITKATATVSRAGFGIPCVFSTEAYADSRFAETAKIYTGIAQLGSTGDNFDTNGPTYKLVNTLFSQNPKPKQIVVAKRANLPTMTVVFTPIAKNSTLYRVTINGSNFDFTSDATATVPEIITGLVAAINGGTENVVATDVGPGTSLQIQAADTPGGSPTAGKTFICYANDRTLLEGQNITADPGIVTDLNTVRTAVDGNDDWYVALMDSFGKAEIEAMAGAIESLLRAFFATTFDADTLTSSTTDVMSVLMAANYARTVTSWHQTPLGADLSAAWTGKCLPKDPGSITWKFKSLSGPAYSVLTPSEIAYVKGKNGNIYTRVAGNNMTEEGVTASGEFFDVTRGIDFITARIKENVFGRMINTDKIPYTDPGVGIIESEVRGVMRLGIANDIFTADPEPTVTVPRVADVDVNDRANRLLPDVSFSAQLAGAIHAVEVSGTVTV